MILICFLFSGDLLNGTYQNGVLQEVPIPHEYRDILYPGAAQGLAAPGVIYKAVRSRHGEIVRTNQFMFYSAEEEVSLAHTFSVRCRFIRALAYLHFKHPNILRTQLRKFI